MKTKTYPLKKSYTSLAIPIIATLVMCSSAANATTTFDLTNLVTDDPSVNSAKITDPNLVNAWGISFSSTGAFWISDNAKGVSTIYSVNPATNATSKVGLTVTIPGAGSVTGQVFNGNSTAFNGDPFLFVSEDGTVSGWRSALGATAETFAPASNAIYKGVAEANVGGHGYLYAANFASGAIDVMKGDAAAPALSGNFADPTLPSGYAPFNIQDLNGKLYVAYAQQTPGSGDETAGPGLGYVSVFDSQGNFLERIASQGSLDAPWGLAIAPSSFGEYAGDLLVGNFGDGTISAFNLITHSFIGQLMGSNGKPLSIDGLWGLSVGNNGGAGSSQTLYFTAGPNGEANGLFGAVSAVPLPPALWLFGSALVGVRLLGKRPNSEV